MQRYLYIVGTMLLWPNTAAAQTRTLTVSSLYAGNLTWGQAISSLIGTLGITIFSVSAAAFMIGALMYTAGFINEENKSKGKQLMIGAIFGMAIVLSAKAIFNTAFFFVYGT